jgi:WhiB family transcriptional regulator, redox-sensing transcriptional regulator
MAVRRLQVPVVDHAPAAVDVADEAGGDVAELGHRVHCRHSTIRPLRAPRSYDRPLVDEAEAALFFLMASEDAPDVAELLAELVSRPAWHRDAACRGMGTETFFVERGQSTDAARAICARCEVRAECLDAALAVPSMGVWGGTTGRGRRVLRRGAA